MADSVLIVDDVQAVLSMLYKVIQGNGLLADTASTGEECLKMVGEKNYDLLLLDINLVNQGLSCCRKPLNVKC